MPDVRPSDIAEVTSGEGTENPPKFLLPNAAQPGKGASLASERPRQAKTRALQAAAESEKALAKSRDEAARASARLLQAEERLLEMKRVRERESCTWAAQVVGLNEQLARLACQTASLVDVGQREKRRLLILSLMILSILATGGIVVGSRFLLPARVHLNPPENSQLGPRHPKPNEKLTEAVLPETEEARALRRLDIALSQLPSGAAPAVLREANRWLLRAGAPVCSVESAAGQPALLVGSATSGTDRASAGPLTSAFSRCAEAIEQNLQQKTPNPTSTK